MDLQRPGKVMLVQPYPDPGTAEPGVDFVVIPGIWNENTPGRVKGSCAWVKPLEESAAGNVRVFLFVYQLEVDGSSLWDQLLNQSSALLSGLEEHRSVPTLNQRPILFICHSLGGLVLKKALTQHGSLRQAYQDATAGIIFLGTPHLVTDTCAGWGISRSLMRASRRDIEKDNMDDSERKSIITTCQKFEGVYLDTPILSVYEQRETKASWHLRKVLLFKNSRVETEMLVTQAMVKIDTKGETLFGADKDHMGLCDIDEGEPLYGRVVEFFSAFVQQAPKAVEVALRPAAAQTVRYANANLRTRSSVSSFAMKSSGQNEPAIYTPESTLSNVTSQAPLDLETGAGEILEQQVRLPFSHTGSVTRNRNFYGRIAELEAIDCAFGLTPRPAQEEDEEAEGFATPKTYALSGMAGIGKTEIAIEYLYSRRDRFDAVIWLYADTAQKMGAQFSVLAKELSHVPVPDSVDDVSARDIVRGWLAAPAGHRNEHGQAVQADVGTWLMVLDNAEQPDVLYEWLPDQGPGCILVTSRIPYVKEGAYRLQRGQHLEPFAPSVGGLMLSELSGRGGEAGAVDASRRISDVLGGVPQALFLMSACIREHQLTLADFEQWYEHDPGQLHGFRASMAGPQTAHGSTIATAWAIEKLGKSTVALLRLLSVLDPDRISESMLRGTETEPASAELDVLPPDYPRQAAGYFAARSELLRASLVVRNMATGELRAHRLVLDVVRLQMDHNMLYSTCAAAAVLLSRAWPYVSGTDPDRNQAWRVPEAERYAPHICRLEALLGQAIRDGRYNGTATIGRLLCSYGWHMTERGAPARTEALSSLAQRILQKAVAGGRAGDEDEDEDEERTTHWLGEAHHNLSLAACHTGSSSGARDAEIWQDILRGRIAKYGRPADQLALATAHNQMGICLARQDRYEDALRSFQLSLAGFRACTDPPRFSGTFPAISISLLCLLLRRPGQAEHYLMPTLLEHERHLGPDDTTTTESGHIWRAMGHIRRGQHRFTEALRYHERALTNIRAIVGDKHHFSGDSFYSVAEDLMQIGDLPVAIQNLDCAIEAFTAGPHRDAQAARALWTKGRALRMMGNEQDSGQLFREAIERRHKLVPGDRRSINELSDNDWTSLVFYWSR